MKYRWNEWLSMKLKRETPTQLSDADVHIVKEQKLNIFRENCSWKLWMEKLGKH